MTEYGNKSQTESRTSSKGGGVSLPLPQEQEENHQKDLPNPPQKHLLRKQQMSMKG